MQLAQRDAAWGAAINARFREGSARQPVRDEAELEYAQQVAAIGACHPFVSAILYVRFGVSCKLSSRYCSVCAFCA